MNINILMYTEAFLCTCTDKPTQVNTHKHSHVRTQK